MVEGILKYWERSLIDSAKMGPPPDKYVDTNESVSLSRDEYAAGKIGKQALEKIINLYKTAYGEPDDRYPISILLFPFVYRPKAVHQQHSAIPVFSALCIPAGVSIKTGLINFKQENAPFIPRRHLKPMGDDFITIGDTEIVDRFLTTSTYAPSNWQEVLTFGENLVQQVMVPEEAVTVGNIEYLQLTHVVATVVSADFNGTRSILGLYANIINSGKNLDLPLLKAYGSLSEKNREKLPLMDIKGSIAAMKKHVGQMNGEFALSETQRIALHHYLSPSNGLILAINGPPGTGKTTLLQSIVANTWVEAALMGKNSPPVIVACSTNNQAVTNIIESFGKVSASPGIIGERWLPDINSYGLYCASATKTTQSEYQRHDTFPSLLENKEYLEKGTECFLKKAKEYFGLSFRSVGEVIDRLQSDLVATAAKISSEADRLNLTIERNDKEIKRIQDDKNKALCELEQIKACKSKLDALQKPKVALQQELKTLQEAVQHSNKDLLAASTIYESFSVKVESIRNLSTKWNIFSLSTPLWMRIFDFTSYARDKWALSAFEFYDQNSVKSTLNSSDRSNTVLTTLKSMSSRIKPTSDIISKEIEVDCQESENALEQMKIELTTKQVNISRLESDNVNCQASLTTLMKQEDDLDRQIKSASYSYNTILARNGLSSLEQNDVAVAFDRLIANVEERCLRMIREEYHETSEQLDINVRSKLFSLATHYWEGQWIKEMNAGLSRGEDYPGKKNRANTEAKWLRYAKLTPLMVSTFHMAPANFAAWRPGPDNKPAIYPLYNYIDLLIVDEAGQVGPDVAAPTFALAQKAIIVGDLFQIEPVWSVPPPIDLGNIRQHCGDKIARHYEELGNDGHGISAASGSVMRIAQMQSSFCTDKLYGMFLREHRRCTNEIIQFCNELAYDGKLIPCRKPAERPDLPHLGWAHISGACKRVAGSRINQTEADVVVSWIKARKASLEQFYNLPIGEIIAVVTPFNPQQRYIRQQLKKHGIKGVTAGTVHALQGAERKIVILSTVYDIKSNVGTMFFDRGINMLNVAVSRAIDSFLVFGDTRILNQQKTSPSGRLAKHLFSSPDNEITDLPLHDGVTTRPKIANATAEIITSLDGHREALSNAFKEAKERVILASPWITQQAIHADQLLEPIQEAISRDVKIIVYTDKYFNLENGNDGKFLKSFSEATDGLKQAGAEVRVVDRIHNKDLVVDSNTLICGSFNWLSAIRNEEHFLSKKNTSVKLTGGEVANLITNVVEEMEDLCKFMN